MRTKSFRARESTCLEDQVAVEGRVFQIYSKINVHTLMFTVSTGISGVTRVLTLRRYMSPAKNQTISSGLKIWSSAKPYVVDIQSRSEQLDLEISFCPTCRNTDSLCRCLKLVPRKKYSGMNLYLKREFFYLNNIICAQLHL